jgi:hypothetical protein
LEDGGTLRTAQEPEGGTRQVGREREGRCRTPELRQLANRTRTYVAGGMERRMSLDPRIEAIRQKYNLRTDDFWELPQKRGSYCVKHSALEIVAAQAGIKFSAPQIIEANGGAGVAAVCVEGEMDGRKVWSIGECNPKNNRNSYPWAMAEKRAIDRVILKLAGIHGLVYSDNEIEGDDAPAQPTQAVKISSYRAKQLFKTDVLLSEIDNAKTLKRCDELNELFNVELAFLPTPWIKQFRDRIDQQREALSKGSEASQQAAVSANESLDQQYRETMRA